MSCWLSRLAMKPRYSSGIRAGASPRDSFSPLPSNLAGTMRSRPYDLPPTWSSIHDNSWSSSCGGNAVAPSTPNPPALVTAATTSRQWLNAKSGKSIPNRSQIAGLTSPVLLSHICRRQEPRYLRKHLASVDQLGVVVPGPWHQHEPFRLGRRVVEPPAERHRHDVVAVTRDHQNRRGHRRSAVDRGIAVEQQPLHRQRRGTSGAQVGESWEG